ncbi:hypothetical protein KUL156_05610 [Alteromonas sp. KUL156]|uniref:hypothetical protein n=1 Tax=Alteromonas sp. KUL106 TaxID=2480799 RepID=UPI0012E5BCFD|nr:hypothetical protein [Alteromonas sp. KUL106]GFD70011.1 hypothetical protein KUL106_32740 [Alteromonas sp. KUL106]GFD78838.1 hypothetical protein KUL118_17000 [Tenacibaculum sp. KUL118]GFD93467.1 hypothetical protein KUL154_22000 [Alteromonas sp. KUL154]GFD97968.1 hypothetical protein KUL156_05610 [Alteromonas sp. KUL156]
MSNAASKKTLIIMVAVFVLPVVLAKLALDNDWFTKGATNKGQLLAPTIDMSALLGDVEPKWRLLYVMPDKCDSVCENALFSINQVWLALGKESDRAEALVVTTSSSDQSAIAALADYPFVETLTVMSPTSLASSSVYIVDTQNNAMLFYEIKDDRKDAVMESRNMLADMRKLLKLSRIG